MIQLHEISFSYKEKQILKDCSYQFQSGKIYMLLGKNGIGKTTLLELLTKNLPLSSGNIHSDFKEEELGYMCQDFFYYEELNVYEMAKVIAMLRKEEKRDFEETFSLLLEKLALKDYEKVLIKDLSLGTRQRVQILFSLLHRPNLIIMDEPSNGLDPAEILRLKKLLREFAEQGKCVIISTHALNLAEELGDEIVVLANGKLTKLEKGSEENLEEVYLRVTE